MKRLLPVLLLLASACTYRPARFANRPPTPAADDRRPSGVPETTAFIKELYQADVYLRRELVNGMDPRRVNDAVDVNALDLVVFSSWYRPQHPQAPLLGYERDGPPVLPLQVLKRPVASGAPDAIAVKDARGLEYEIQNDVPDREGMRPAAAAIASRLVHALGYRTPEVYRFVDAEGVKAATRWPVGIDLGPTPINRVRGDDPNDVLPHVDRRSLRALMLVNAWLGMNRTDPRVLRDVYVGTPGKGHVQHWIVGVDGALGVDEYLGAVEFALDPDRERSNFFLRVFSLGLSPKPPGILPRTPGQNVGLYTDRLLPGDWDTSPPFEPFDKLTPADAYWMAKKIAGIPRKTVTGILTQSGLDDADNAYLFQALHQRRATLIAWAFDNTTPCEHIAIEGFKTLRIADLAINSGFVEPSERTYDVSFMNSDGDAIGSSRTVTPKGVQTLIDLPPDARKHEYVVVRIHAARNGAKLPRAMEVHLRVKKEAFRLAGVRH